MHYIHYLLWGYLGLVILTLVFVILYIRHGDHKHREPTGTDDPYLANKHRYGRYKWDETDGL